MPDWLRDGFTIDDAPPVALVGDPRRGPLMAGVHDQELIQFILGGESTARAAQHLGFEVSLVYRRVREDDFQAKLAAARSELVERSQAAIIGIQVSAVATLAEIMTDRAAPSHSRLRAAEIILLRGQGPAGADAAVDEYDVASPASLAMEQYAHIRATLGPEATQDAS